MRNILLVEDDVSLAEVIAKDFQERSYHVTLCHLGSSAVKKIKQQYFDLIILDQTLPDMDGLDLIEHINNESFRTRILMVSSNREVQHRVLGLSKGADDYLGKPFTFAELLLRTQKLIYSRKLMDQSFLPYQQTKFYPQSGIVEGDQNQTKLRPRESLILECLINHHDQVVSRKNIFKWVWGSDDNVPCETTLDVYIRRLRTLVSGHNYHIETIRGFGYRLSTAMA